MKSLFLELKRRKVFRVAAVYAVVAWLLIQIVTAILPTFEAPQWVSQSIVFLIILGFPSALVLAWAYELTPDGIRADTGEGAESERNTETATIVGNEPVIVVLPFRTRENDEVEQLTAEGLTDDITTLLTLAYSRRRLPPNPRQSCHPFQSKAATPDGVIQPISTAG